jgi:hypothetical protein
MQITARIKRASAIWRLWQGNRRTGGMVAGVQFTSAPGDNYIAENLAPAQAKALENHSDVVLEMFTTPHPAPVSNTILAEPLPSPVSNTIVFDLPEPVSLGDITPEPDIAPPPARHRHQQSRRKG